MSSTVRWEERYPRIKQSKHWEQLQLCSACIVKRTFLPHSQPAVQVLGLCIAISQLELSTFSVLFNKGRELRQLPELGQSKTFSRQTTAVGDLCGLGGSTQSFSVMTVT